jgi:signal transduction histidine kinase
VIAALPVFGRTSAAVQLGLAAWLLGLAAAAEITRILARFRRAEADERAHAQEARRELAARRAGEQRLRIAQDLHDVLAHQLALITVQANVGLAMLEREPGRASDALSAIKDAGNSALGELPTVLGMLRTPDGAAPRGPVPLLSRDADLAQLAEGTQAAGRARHRHPAAHRVRRAGTALVGRR